MLAASIVLLLFGTPPLPADEEAHGGAVFTEQLDLTQSELRVTVVDRNGVPVRGLRLDDFRVSESGEAMQLAYVRPAADAGAAAAGQPSGVVAVLFDQSSLTRRTRSKVLEALEPFLATAVARGDRVLFADCGESLHIQAQIARSSQELGAALARVSEIEGFGDSVRANKRMVHRSILGATAFRMIDNSPRCANTSNVAGGGRGGSTAAPAVDLGLLDPNFGLAQAQGFLNQVNALSDNESRRVQGVLAQTAELVLALGGMRGAKTVILVAEDLAMSPCADIYSDFAKRFRPWQGQVGFEEPEFWARNHSLRAAFEQVVTMAQASGVVLHVLDASHRDRQAARTDFNASNPTAQMFPAMGSLASASGVDLVEGVSLAAGGDFLAASTGGTVLVASADYARYFAGLEQQWDGVYLVGYVRPGAPDGGLHPVQVEAINSDFELHHSQRVVHSTPEQSFVASVLTTLQLGEELNPMAVELTVDGTSATDDKERLVHLEVMVPLLYMQLAPADGREVGELLVLVMVRRGDGTISPPQLVTRQVAVPEQHSSPGSRVRLKLDLKMEEGTDRVAVGVRDQGSGVVSTTATAL